MNIKNISILLVILVATLSRFIPHPPNFTPIIAIGLFSGFYLKDNKKMALLLPLFIMIISDIFLGFYLISIFVYLSLGVIVFLGSKIPNKNKFTTLFPVTLGSSLLFFIISNFGVFLIGYPDNISGFIACYTMALPFFYTSILGDLFFTGTIFLSYHLIKSNIPQLNSNIA